MQILRKLMRLSKAEYFETHLLLINCILPKEVRMTPMEIKVLAGFMSLEGHITENRFGSTGNKIVRESLGLSTAGLSNYMRSLSNKKIIFTDPQTNKKTIFPKLIPEEKEQQYFFKLVNTMQ